MLTKGSWRAGTQCSGAGVEVRRRRTAEHDDGVAGGELWSSWSCGWTCDVPVMRPRESGGPEMLRRRGNAVVPEFTGVGLRRNSGGVRVDPSIRWHGDVPDVEAERVRGSWRPGR